MERLTEWIGEGTERYAIPSPHIRSNGHRRCCNRLAEYEDLDVEPEQVREMGGTKKNVFRISYYLPGQSRLFSGPQVFECRDAGDLQEAVRKAQEKGYDVVSIDYQKEEP